MAYKIKDGKGPGPGTVHLDDTDINKGAKHNLFWFGNLGNLGISPNTLKKRKEERKNEKKKMTRNLRRSIVPFSVTKKGGKRRKTNKTSRR